MGGTFDGVSGIESSGEYGLRVGKLGVIESAHARCWVLRDRMRFIFGWEQTNLRTLLLPAGAGAGRYRPYFENYTVDASIFEMIFIS
jgi:hypothetical protein